MSGLSHRIGRDRRAPGKGPAVVTPASIFGANLAYWHDSTRGVVPGTPPAVATWEDQSGNGNHYAQGTALLRPQDTGAGIAANGTTEYMVAPDAASLDFTTAATWAINFTPDVTTSTRSPNCKGGSGSGSWSFQSNATAMRFHIGVPGLSFGEVAAMLSAGVRVSIIVVFNGAGVDNATRLQMYLNGVAQTITFSGTIPASIPVGADTMGVFAYNTPNSYWDGVGRMTVGANVVANAAQIAAIHAFGAALP